MMKFGLMHTTESEPKVLIDHPHLLFLVVVQCSLVTGISALQLSYFCLCTESTLEFLSHLCWSVRRVCGVWLAVAKLMRAFFFLRSVYTVNLVG